MAAGLTLAFAPAAHAGEWVYHLGWLPVGHWADSRYDDGCQRLWLNRLGKNADGVYGTTAFIDPNGHWHYTNRNAHGETVSFIPSSAWASFTKKAHCRNSDPWSTYAARCGGMYDSRCAPA